MQQSNSNTLHDSVAPVDEIKKWKDEEDDLPCEWGCRINAKCQYFRDPRCVLFWFCVASMTQGMVVNGFVSSSITSLEKRFSLQSLESGAIASFYDIGSLICLIPVTYYGGLGRRPRWVSVGLFIMGIGSLVYALPQFIIEKYKYSTPLPTICYNATKDYPNYCTNLDSNLNIYKYVFYLGQFLHGVGASPFYTLAVSFLDDNLSNTNSALYFGIFYTMSLIGPALGYLIGGALLDVYVDVGSPHPGLELSNKSMWIGAWWIGFIICLFMAWIGAVPIFGFPKVLPKTAGIRAAKKDESYKKKSNVDELDKDGAVRQFSHSLSIILCNPTFIFISLSGAVESQILGGFTTFGPKILETMFSLEAGWATMLIGIVTIPSGGLGMLLGGVVIKVTNMSIRRVLISVVIVCGLSLICVSVFFFKCSSTPFNGISDDSYNLTTQCNGNCGCRQNQFMFALVCGLDNVHYFSACYAGCTNNFTSSEGTIYYSNCSCINATSTIGQQTYSAKLGNCTNSKCTALIPFLILFAVLVFLTFYIVTPCLTATLRVLPAPQRSLGLGVQWIIVRIFGAIPAPLYFGVLIDKTCSLWSGSCGDLKGSCSHYNDQKVQTTLLYIAFIGKGLSFLALLLAACLYQSEKTMVNNVCRSENIQHDNSGYESENL